MPGFTHRKKTKRASEPAGPSAPEPEDLEGTELEDLRLKVEVLTA